LRQVVDTACPTLIVVGNANAATGSAVDVAVVMPSRDSSVILPRVVAALPWLSRW
jgi:hypothetical protein